MSRKKTFAEKQAAREALRTVKQTPFACFVVFDNEADYDKWSCPTPGKSYKEWREKIEEMLKRLADRGCQAMMIPVMFNEQGYTDYCVAKGLPHSRKTLSEWAGFVLENPSPLVDRFVGVDTLDRDQRLCEETLPVTSP